jgi:hypothetical protein
MRFVFLVMVILILGGLLLERILPRGLKDRLGAAICWGMMAITMGFLGASTLGLLAVLWIYYLQPAISS